MVSFSKVIILGNLTRDTELRHIPSGTPVCDISLAVNEKRKTSDGAYVDDVVFVEVTLWGRTAENASEFLEKGSPVLIEGRLKLDTWESDGQKRSKLKVVGEKLHLLGSRGGNREGRAPSDSSGKSGRRPNSRNDGDGNEDIPF